MTKKILAGVLIVLSVVSLCACGSKGISEALVEEPVSATIEVVDQMGREVTLEKKPEKIVSSYYITTSAFLALGLRDRIVGIESNPEKRPIYNMCDPDILQIASVGSPKEFDLEACAALSPDLVVLPMRAKDMVEPLTNLNIPVIVVNPEGENEIKEMLMLIAKAAGEEEKGKELTDYIAEKTKWLRDKLDGCDTPSVYLGGNSSFLSTAASGMYQNDLIIMAGGANVAGEIDDTYWVESSFEQILSWNPQVIAMASDASYTMEEIMAEASLKECQAIRDQKVYKIPADIEAWDSPVPSSFLGAVYLASAIHPDRISEEEYKSLVEEYYELFYGFSVEK